MKNPLLSPNFWITQLTLALTMIGWAGAAQGQASSAHIELEGKKLLDAELPFAFQQRLYEIHKSVYEVRLEVYKNYLFGEHVKALAAKEKKQVDEMTDKLLTAEEPSDKELKKHYDQFVASDQYPFEAVKEHLKADVVQRKRHEIKLGIIEDLVKKKGFKYLTAVPVAPIAKISLAGAAKKGASKPKVTVVKFSDFYCSQCKSMSKTLNEILSKKAYKNKVEVIYAPFAVFGEKATQIATESFCAHEQNKFWEFHDKVFALGSDKLQASSGKTVATELSLDMTKFEQCLKSEAATTFVSQSKNEGVRLGVKGTPTLYVGGKKVLNATVDGLTEALDKALATP